MKSFDLNGFVVSSNFVELGCYVDTFNEPRNQQGRYVNMTRQHDLLAWSLFDVAVDATVWVVVFKLILP